MWSILNGTIINAAAVAVGSLLGVRMGQKLGARYRSIVLQALGLITILLGIDAGALRFADTVERVSPLVKDGRTYGARLAMAMIVCLILGALIGTALRLHERIEALGAWIHARFSGQDGHTFAEGFLTASVIFCIGPLTLLGCLQNGAHGDPSYLYIKSLLDGVCSLALASSLGWGVVASVIVVLVFQGSLSVLAKWFAEPLDDVSLALMTIVGGIVLLATAFMILEIKKIPVANLLPGIFLPPLIVWIVEMLHPGALLPAPF